MLVTFFPDAGGQFGWGHRGQYFILEGSLPTLTPLLRAQDHEDITPGPPANTVLMWRKNVFFCFVIIRLTGGGRWQGGTYREVLMGRLAWLWHRIHYTQTNKLQINSYPALGWTHLHLHPTSCIKQWNLLKSQFRDWKFNWKFLRLQRNFAR